jgi:hypothetical protein
MYWAADGSLAGVARPRAALTTSVTRTVPHGPGHRSVMKALRANLRPRVTGSLRSGPDLTDDTIAPGQTHDLHCATPVYGGDCRSEALDILKHGLATEMAPVTPAIAKSTTRGGGT